MNEPDNAPVGSVDPDESRLQAIVESFLLRMQAGECPDPSDYVLDNPSLAARLESRLEAVRFLQFAATLPGQQATLTIPDVVGRYREAGLNEFIIDHPKDEQLGVLEQVAADVLPKLRKAAVKA